MKIFVTCSKSFYKDVPAVAKKLAEAGHEVIWPTLYNDADAEKALKLANVPDEFKRKAYAKSKKLISSADAILCLNFDKASVAGYVGMGMMLEIFEAFMLSKKIFLWNPLPDGMMHSELLAFKPIVVKKRVANII